MKEINIDQAALASPVPLALVCAKKEGIPEHGSRIVFYIRFSAGKR